MFYFPIYELLSKLSYARAALPSQLRHILLYYWSTRLLFLFSASNRLLFRLPFFPHKTVAEDILDVVLIPTIQYYQV